MNTRPPLSQYFESGYNNKAIQICAYPDLSVKEIEAARKEWENEPDQLTWNWWRKARAALRRIALGHDDPKAEAIQTLANIGDPVGQALLAAWEMKEERE